MLQAAILAVAVGLSPAPAVTQGAETISVLEVSGRHRDVQWLIDDGSRLYARLVEIAKTPGFRESEAYMAWKIDLIVLKRQWDEAASTMTPQALYFGSTGAANEAFGYMEELAEELEKGVATPKLRWLLEKVSQGFVRDGNPL